jgi:hypothetical protein
LLLPQFLVDFFIYFSATLKKLFVYIILSFFCCGNFFAQEVASCYSEWQIKPVINQGFILIHRTSIGHLVKGYPTIYELNVSRPTWGDKTWQIENNKPDIGVSMQCIDFKNPQQLGYAITIAPYIEVPLNACEKKSRVVMRLCWGLNYITKHFDVNTNRKNIAIGSNFNSFVQFKWLWHLKLSERLRFEPGFAFSHISNGKSRNPNLGLNVVSLNAGLNYMIPSRKSRPQIRCVDSSTCVRSKNELLFFTAIGFNQREIATPDMKVITVSGAYQRNVRNTHKFSAGVDLFYDENYHVDYEERFLKKATGFDQMRVSVRLGYSYNFGRISLPIEMGYYAFQKTKPDGYVVSRIGVRYYSKSGVVAHFGLRTHFAVAYNFEYGLGYRFYLK